MASELKLFSGKCKYKDIDFTFVFDCNELRLIPPADAKDTIQAEWIMTPLVKGVYIKEDPLTMDDPYLTGHCSETNTDFIFITKQGDYISSRNSVLFVPVVAYIDCKYARDSIARMSFSCPVINRIHPISQGIGISMDVENFVSTGVCSVTTQSFDETTTVPQNFTVDDRQISVEFSISRILSTKIDEPPITLESAMLFEFEPTNDYHFIYKLWRVAKQFFQYLCYRKNVFLPETVLFAPADGGKFEAFATLHILNESGDDEGEKLKSGRYIKQRYLAGAEGKILTDIANGKLYLRHLPQSYRGGRSIDASRFIMIMAAFEWEFRRCFPDGITKSAATISAEDAVYTEIQKLLDCAGNRKERRLYQFLQRLVKSDSLESEIIHTGKELDGIIGVFGKNLYSRNNQELKYSEMGKRLSSQRNNYAHGNLDKEFIGLSLLDLMYMEYVLYAMQLNYYSVDTTNIRHAINDLFHLNYAIDP